MNKFWKQHLRKEQLYGRLHPISKAIQVIRTRHAWDSWRNKDELISDVHQWTPTHERASVDRPARTYLQYWRANENLLYPKRNSFSRQQGRRCCQKNVVCVVYLSSAWFMVMIWSRHSLLFRWLIIGLSLTSMSPLLKRITFSITVRISII